MVEPDRPRRMRFACWITEATVKLTTHLHLVPRLSMIGGIPLYTLYALMAWKGAVLPLSVQQTDLSADRILRYNA
jgi:hypothetical protein